MAPSDRALPKCVFSRATKTRNGAKSPPRGGPCAGRDGQDNACGGLSRGMVSLSLRKGCVTEPTAKALQASPTAELLVASAFNKTTNVIQATGRKIREGGSRARRQAFRR